MDNVGSIHSAVECFVAKRRSIFRKSKFLFDDRDIMEDPSALRQLKKLGFMTTPVLVMHGNLRVGFDQGKIDEALQEPLLL